MGLSGIEVVHMDPTHHRIPGRLGPGDPSSILTEAGLGESTAFVSCERRSLATLDVDAMCSPGLVGVDQVVGIRCPPDVVLERAHVGGEPTRLVAAITTTDEELVLARLVGEVGDPLAVGTPARAAFREPRGAREVPRAAVLRRERPDVATGLDRDSLAGRRDREILHEVGGIHHVGAQAGRRTGHLDLHLAGGAVIGVVDVEVRSVLEDESRRPLVVGSDRGPLDVVLGEVGQLFVRSFTDVVAPEVESVLGAGIGEVVEVLPVPHRHRVRAFPVGDPSGSAVLEVHQPDVAGHAPAVALPRPTVTLVRGVGDPGTGPVDRSVRAVGHRECIGQAAFAVHSEDPFRTRDPAHAPGTEEKVTVGGPVAQPLAGRVVGDPTGHAAASRHHVEVAVAVVVSDERDFAAIRREAGNRLDSGGRGEGKGDATVGRHSPEIVRIDEHDLVVGDVGESVHRGTTTGSLIANHRCFDAGRVFVLDTMGM